MSDLRPGMAKAGGGVPAPPPPPRLRNSDAWCSSLGSRGASSSDAAPGFRGAQDSIASWTDPVGAYRLSTKELSGNNFLSRYQTSSTSTDFARLEPGQGNSSVMKELDDLFRPRGRSSSTAVFEAERNYPSSRSLDFSSREESGVQREILRDVPRFVLPEKVFSCQCKVVVYSLNYGAGVAELLGSGGITAYCFFRSENVLARSTDSLKDQIKIGVEMMVHGMLIEETRRIPYCASFMWFSLSSVNKNMDANYFPPTQEDILFYKRLVRDLEVELLKYQHQQEIQQDTFNRHDIHAVGRADPLQSRSRLSPVRSRSEIQREFEAEREAAIREEAEERQRLQMLAEKERETARLVAQKKAEEEEALRKKQIEKTRDNLHNKIRKKMAEELGARKEVPTTSATTRLFNPSSEVTAVQAPAAAGGGLALFNPPAAIAYPPPAGIPLPPTGMRPLGLPPPPSGSVRLPTIPPAGSVASGALLNFHTFGTAAKPMAMVQPAAVPTSVRPPQIATSTVSASTVQAEIDRLSRSVGGSRSGQTAVQRDGGAGSRKRRRSERGRNRSGSSLSSSLSPSPVRGRTAERRRSRSPLRIRGTARISPVRRRSRSRGRRTGSRSPLRVRSGSRDRRGPTARPAHSRSRSRSVSREQRRRFQLTRRSRSRGRRSRSPRRRSISPLHRSRSNPRRRTRSKSRSPARRGGRAKTRSRSRSRRINEILGKPTGDPKVPSFLRHPAEMMSTDKSKSVRKAVQGKDNQVADEDSEAKRCRQQALECLDKMGFEESRAPPDANLQKALIVTLEMEILYDEAFKQFTQVGAALTDDKQISFFRSILPRYMEHYNKNLILKNQINLLSSLGLKYDEALKRYLFTHKNNKQALEPVTEELALENLLGFLRINCHSRRCVIIMHSMDTFLPLFVAKLKMFGLYREFRELVIGFCDFTSLMTTLKMGQICKVARFQDMVDVYKQVMGKAWPKDVTHRDGVACLGDDCTKRLLSEITNYLEKQRQRLDRAAFFSACGYRSFVELAKDAGFGDTVAYMQHQKCGISLNREKAKSVELCPSDRPGEVTIVTLKRFECIDVDDLDEVEEEGISENEFFEAEAIDGVVLAHVVIKPGFVVPVMIELKSYPSENADRGVHVLVAKHPAFGSDAYVASIKNGCNEGGDALAAKVNRLTVAAKCNISRQIVTVTVERNSGKFFKDMASAQVKVLNPGDVDLVLEPGDVIASIKPEKISATLNYTQMKEQRSLEEAKRQDDMLRQEEAGERHKKKKKKTKKKNKKSGPSAEEPEKETVQEEPQQRSDGGGGGLSFDLDALDFEPQINSDDSDVSLSDSEPEKEDEAASRTDSRRSTTDQQSAAATVEMGKDPADEADDSGLPTAGIHEVTFFATINNAAGLELAPYSHQFVALRVKPRAGYSVVHMVGKQCVVSRRPEIDFSFAWQKDVWKYSAYDITRHETVVRRCEKTGVALVNAWVFNRFDKTVFFSNGTALARVNFYGLNDEPALGVPAAGATAETPKTPDVQLVAKRNPTAFVPSMEALGKLTVKDLKTMLSEHNLPLSGLKKSLVSRLYDFYKEDPDRVDQSLLPDIPAPVASASVTSAPVGRDERENRRGSAAGRHGENGDVIIPPSVLAASSDILAPPGDDEAAAAILASRKAQRKDAGSTEALRQMRDKVAIRQAEISALEVASIKFHEIYHDISLQEELVLPAPGFDAVVPIKLVELELFATELADRHVFIHYRSLLDSRLVVKSQIAKVKVDGKMPVVEVLLRSRFASIAPPLACLLRLRIERTELDSDNQFFLPLSDTFEPAPTEALFDLQCPTVAATLADVILLPKSFHTELCHVPLKPNELETLNDELVIIERTADHGMNIGMRKLILVPKVVGRLSCDSERATILVRIYNASKQRLRLSKNTNIARVYLPRVRRSFVQRTTATIIEEKSLHCGDRATVSAKLALTENLSDGMAVLVVPSTKLDSQLIALSGLAALKKHGVGDGFSAYVDVTLINPTPKYMAVRNGTEVSEVFLAE